MMDSFSPSTFAPAEAPADDAPSRSERRDQQVQRILEAAKACFVRWGFQGASMHQICAEVGMSPGALYRYFPSKEAIIEAIAAADRKHDAEILAMIGGGESVLDGMMRAGMAHIRHIHDTGDAPLFMEIRAESMRNDAVLQACQACMSQVEGDFRRHLEAAIARGEIDPCLPIESLLPFLMAMGEGIGMNDLPALGVPLDHIETGLRAVLTALLRPRGPSASGANEKSTRA